MKAIALRPHERAPLEAELFRIGSPEEQMQCIRNALVDALVALGVKGVAEVATRNRWRGCDGVADATAAYAAWLQESARAAFEKARDAEAVAIAAFEKARDAKAVAFKKARDAEAVAIEKYRVAEEKLRHGEGAEEAETAYSAWFQATMKVDAILKDVILADNPPSHIQAADSLASICRQAIERGQVIDRDRRHIPLLLASIENHGKLTQEGRDKGGDTMKERAAKRRDRMRNAVEDILKNRATVDWDEGRIADFLMMEGFHEYEGVKPIGKKQMMRDIKKIKADFKASSR